MSSACVCHTDEWCFYCNMYSPLEKRHEDLKSKVELLVEDYERRVKSTVKMLDDHQAAPAHQRSRVEGKNEAYRDFIRYLRGLLDDESTT